MTVMQTLCDAPLAMTDGVPMGVAGYPGYRFAVQLALTDPGSVLPFVLGSSTLGGPRWKDITKDCHGLEWSRGGQPGQRPMAGELTMRLLNTNGVWAPWRSGYYGPGTLMRTVIGNGTLTKPQWTGMVQTWVESTLGVASGQGYEWVDITAWELLFLLSESNDNALAGVVGGGETLTQRVDRLLVKAAWSFGYTVNSTSIATYQSTDLAQDMATELYVTVDSVDAVVFSGKDGDLIINDRFPADTSVMLPAPAAIGNYIQTPDAAVLDIVGDIEIVARVSFDDWHSIGVGNTFASRQSGTLATSSFDFNVDNSGHLQFSWTNAAGAFKAATSNSTFTFVDGSTHWVKVTLDVDNGAAGNTARFYTAPDQIDEPTVWTQLGTNIVAAGVTTINASACPLGLGTFVQQSAGKTAGKLYRVIVRNGIGGPAVADYNAADNIASTASWVSRNTGETWTMYGLATVERVGTYRSWVFAHDDRNPDTTITANDDDRILSSVALARVGGTEVVFDNSGVAGRYQKRTTHRNDLITVAEAGNADLARVAAGMLGRANETYRPVSVDVESGQGITVATMLIEADITDRITIDRVLPEGDRLMFNNYAICGISTAIQVSGAGTYWRATLFTDIEADSNWMTTLKVAHSVSASATGTVQTPVIRLTAAAGAAVGGGVSNQATTI